MIIGIPREIKTDERRVSLTPDKVDQLVRDGHRVIVESSAGDGAGFRDEDFKAVGAEIVKTAKAVWEAAQMVVKVKEPQKQEVPFLRKDLLLFTYLHLAPEKELTAAMLKSGVTGLAYETVERGNQLPLLYPMSEIAGKLAALVAARFLQVHEGGPGKLMVRVPGIEPCNVLVIGGGTVGLNAAVACQALGADVTIADVDLDRLRYIDNLSHMSMGTLYSTPANLAKRLQRADVVVGAVLRTGAMAPKVVTREMLATMPDRSIVVDVAIDQGGSVEGIRSTTHSNPTYVAEGVIHYAVPNMPGVVPHTSSMSLSNATIPYVRRIAARGLAKVVREDPGVAKGVNVVNGHLTYAAVAEAQGLKYVALEEAMPA